MSESIKLAQLNFYRAASAMGFHRLKRRLTKDTPFPQWNEELLKLVQEFDEAYEELQRIENERGNPAT